MKDKDVWGAAAYDILVEVGGRYHAVIGYSELGEEIQRRSGVTTRMAIRNWIGGVPAIVVHPCARDGIPALTALVVRKHTGMGGEGYDAVLKVEGIAPHDDVMEREQHAAQARLECYRWARASGLPDAGPALPPGSRTGCGAASAPSGPSALSWCVPSVPWRSPPRECVTTVAEPTRRARGVAGWRR